MIGYKYEHYTVCGAIVAGLVMQLQNITYGTDGTGAGIAAMTVSRASILIRV
jgi:hypothetical protein